MYLKKILTVIWLSFIVVMTFGQDMLQQYERAELLLPRNLKNKIYTQWVAPKPIEGSDFFWYTAKTADGTKYQLVNPIKNSKVLAFNHEKMAAAITKTTKDTVSAYKLGISNIEFNKELKWVRFKKDTLLFQCNLNTYEVEVVEKPTEYKKTESISPDSSQLAFIKDYNIWLRSVSTGKETQLTTDGEELYPYGGSISWYFTQNESANQAVEFEIDVDWSKDGKKLLISRYDRRNAQKLYMYKSLPEKGWRSEIYSYYRPLAGDSLVTTVEYYVANLEISKVVKLDLHPIPTFANYGTEWSKDNKLVYNIFYERGWQKGSFTKTNAVTGKTKVIYSETSNTYVDPMMGEYKLIKDEKELLCLSEQDGWNHIYRINTETGAIINQVTKGEYVVRNINYVDKKGKKIYFTANGKEKDRDPYYEYLYVTDYAGKSVELLTPENAYHNITFTNDNKFFVDNFSRVNLPNKAVLRNTKTGKIIITLENTDASILDSLGVTAPEQYVVKGRDGKTDIYGVIYRPSNFNANKSYPVIDYSYSGPQTIVTPKTFSRGVLNMNYAIAELGFIVVTVDGLGSAWRSKEFHDKSYKNLGDIGGPDHIKAIKTLAEKYPYMDTTRVGMWGHSAGGYDAVRALIAYNNFYKVSVSSAGNHDHRIAKAWWPEVYMGYPAGKHYDEQSNILNASKLKGKLLLAHGDLDNNVNPSGSTRMAAELIKANKDFELLMIPNVNHGGLWWDSYFIRKRWDFFVKNLMGVEPPLEYKIK